MKKSIIIGIVVLVLLIGAGYFAKKQMDKAMKYCYVYNFKKSRVIKASATALDIDFAVDFKNNSDIEAQIDGYKFDVLINGIKVSEVKTNTVAKIAANAFTTIVVPIKVNPTSLLSKKLINQETIKNFISDKSKIKIGIKGSVSGGALGVKVKDMPIEVSYTLAEMMKPSGEATLECK